MKNVLLYSLFHRANSEGEFFSMLHYSLYTLKKQKIKSSFDVVVMMCSDDKNFDLLNYNHLNQFCLKNDFPEVKFILTDYNDNPHMSKWYHIQKTFELGYDKVFFLDCDTIFFDDPSEFFDYDMGSVYCLREMRNRVNDILLKQDGINSGHVVLDRIVFEKIPNFYKTIVNRRLVLNNNARYLLGSNNITKLEYENFCFFNEQYCAQMCFVDRKIPIISLNVNKINWLPPDIKINHGVNTVINVTLEPCPSIIFHYASCNAHIYLPQKYHTKYLSEKWLKSQQHVKSQNRKIFSLYKGLHKK